MKTDHALPKHIPFKEPPFIAAPFIADCMPPAIGDSP
jgi:hypothetical protein